MSALHVMGSKHYSVLFLATLFAFTSVITLPFIVVSAATTKAETVVQQINIWQAIFLGFIQGATEFLPISSTAHLKAISVVLGWGDPGVGFTAVIQLGSIAAVLWYFRKDLMRILKGAKRAIALSDYDDYDFRLSVGIVLGTLPIVLCGLLIEIVIPDYNNSPLRSMEAIAIASIMMSILLGLSEKFGKFDRDFEHLTLADGLLMGVVQTLALIPGVSRSGATLTAGLFANLERETAARFSFLLGIPAITLAGLVKLSKYVFASSLVDSEPIAILAGVISSAVFSYLAITALLRFLKTKTTWVFVWYRLAFGTIILSAIGARFLQNI